MGNLYISRLFFPWFHDISMQLSFGYPSIPSHRYPEPLSLNLAPCLGTYTRADKIKQANTYIYTRDSSTEATMTLTSVKMCKLLLGGEAPELFSEMALARVSETAFDPITASQWTPVTIRKAVGSGVGLSAPLLYNIPYCSAPS
jgi:hypothetical protein